MPSEQERLGLRIQNMRDTKPQFTASQCHDFIMLEDALDEIGAGTSATLATHFQPNANGTSH